MNSKCFVAGVWLLVGAGAVTGLVAAEPGEPADTPLYRVPRLDGIEIDGRAEDWGDRGFRVDVLAPLRGRPRPTSDLDARFRVGWSDEGLLLLFDVRDDLFLEHPSKDTLWQRDSVEIYAADDRGGTEMVQVVVAPGMTNAHEEARWHVHDHRQNEELKETAYQPRVARTKTDAGYVLEVRMPWEGLGVEPKLGRRLGLQVLANDLDDPEARVFNALWYPGVAVFVDRNRLHALELATTASAPAAATARLRCEGLQHTVIRVVADESQAARSVRAQVGRRVVGRGMLHRNGGRAVAVFRAPVPPPGEAWEVVDVYVEDRLVQRLPMPDLEDVRNYLRRSMPVRFESYCFAGNRLPRGGFANGDEAVNVFGPHTVSVRYYDADFNLVTSAETPGRYGAVVEIAPQEGDPAYRMATLFRFPVEVDWRGSGSRLNPPDVKFSAKVDFPEGIGFDDSVVEEQQHVLGDFVHDRIVESFRSSPESARVFACLYETDPGTVVTSRNGPRSRELAWSYELRRRIGLDEPYKYLVRAPAEADEPGAEKRRYPAIILLHGSGGSRVMFERLGNNGVFTFLGENPDLPFYAFSPQCPRGEWWQTPKLDDLFEEIVEKYPVDPARVCLIGHSLGGYGTWLHGAARPDRFAALVPVCGGGDPREAPFLAKTAVWAFHGAKDGGVPVERSREMIEALREQGAAPRLTVYPDGGHAVWDQVYQHRPLYKWLLEQRRGRPPGEPGNP